MAFLVVLLATACSPSPAPWREDLFVFGTRASIEIRAAPPERAARATAELAASFAAFHRDWHAWEPSALTGVNAAIASGQATDAPDSILHAVERAQQLHDRTGGLVDVGIGGLVALWGFHTSDYPLTTPAPTAAAIRAWRDAAPSVSDLRLEGRRIVSANPEVQLDFGAIAEGLAAESALASLRANGIDHALLNLGGDVAALGNADGRPWRIGLRDPFGEVLGTVTLGDGEALFASGNYNKYRLDADGQRWPHILDPRSGRPARGIATAVVLHPDPVLADAAATALLIAGFEGFPALLARLGVRCALLLSEDDELWTTTAMAERLHVLRVPRARRAPLDRGPGCAAPQPTPRPAPQR